MAKATPNKPNQQTWKGRKFSHLVWDMQAYWCTPKEKEAYASLSNLVGETQAATVHGLYSDLIRAKQEFENCITVLEGQLK